MRYAITILLLCAGCMPDEGGSDEPLTDCREASRACAAGFQCATNSAGLYECQPGDMVTNSDVAVSPMGDQSSGLNDNEPGMTTPSGTMGDGASGFGPNTNPSNGSGAQTPMADSNGSGATQNQGSSGNTDSCPTNWVEHDGSCYALFTESSTWAEAETHCQGFSGGHLVSIGSAEEQAVVDNVAAEAMEIDQPTNDSNGGSFWIGLSDQGHEADWRWSDGSPLTFTNWNACSGEPNHNGRPGVEDFAMQYVNKLRECCPDWRWGDHNGSSDSIPFVCEIPVPR